MKYVCSFLFLAFALKCWNCDSRTDDFCETFNAIKMPIDRLWECPTDCVVYTRFIGTNYCF